MPYGELGLWLAECDSVVLWPRVAISFAQDTLVCVAYVLILDDIVDRIMDVCFAGTLTRCGVVSIGTVRFNIYIYIYIYISLFAGRYVWSLILLLSELLFSWREEEWTAILQNRTAQQRVASGAWVYLALLQMKPSTGQLLVLSWAQTGRQARS